MPDGPPVNLIPVPLVPIIPLRLRPSGASVERIAVPYIPAVELDVPGILARLRAWWSARIYGVAYLGIFAVSEVLLFEWIAARTRYGLRVVSDTPTYVALLRTMAQHPFAPPASVLASPGRFNVAHATPDLQLEALVWRVLANFGVIPHNMVDLLAAYNLLAVKGAIVTVVLFHALFLWIRRLAGRRVAWIGISILPLMWGPALIICPGDLSLHGFLYSSYLSEMLGTALLLYALLALQNSFNYRYTVVASIAVGATMVTHPFTGLRLAVLASALACYSAARGKEWRMAPIALAAGFALASLWPMYNLSSAMWIGGFSGRELMAVLVTAPILARLGRRAIPRIRVPVIEGEKLAWLLALFGLVLVVGVAAREIDLFPHHDPNYPLVLTNRTSLYWVTTIGRWPFLLGAAMVGVAGLIRLARRGAQLPVMWFAGCYAIGLIGALGILPIPLWHRFLLFTQIPLALGVAIVIVESRPRLRRFVVATMIASTLFAMGTLVSVGPRITYFGSGLQSAYELDRLVPPASDTIIASDPQTEYYLLVTGNRIFTITQWHVDTQAEGEIAAHNYTLLHRLYAAENWRHAAQRMYNRGVRYIVINTTISLNRATLTEFSSPSPPLPRTAADRLRLSNYSNRVSEISTHVGNWQEFGIYRLDPARLFPDTAAIAGCPAVAGPRGLPCDS